MLNKQMSMIQTAQTKLTATNMLLVQMQINNLLTNEEAEDGVSSKSEDVEEDDGVSKSLLSTLMLLSNSFWKAAPLPGMSDLTEPIVM